ncbi:MAG: fumarylacetoacetate hydrolase family protein [Candidatus Eisenbacteria sp.]|nr:fumarylacetoacetate hydrolase family protein [Candidatus Eisenbacteria bacterium]
MFSAGGEKRIGLMTGDSVIDFCRAAQVYELADKGSSVVSEFRTLEAMIEGGHFSRDSFSSVVSFLEKHGLVEDFTLEGEIAYELPISRPSKILALGRNYRAHAEESGLDVPDEPIIFDKVTTSMVAHGGDIVYPPQVTRMDHEIELAVVIGRRAKDIRTGDAWDYIAGYTIANDVSARHMQERDIGKGNPWLRSKSFDTFAPMGPYLVPRDAVSDAHNLELELKVNGEVRQRSNTSKMVFKIPEVISFISSHMTLLPGDIILTGTPEGISPLVPGDVVEATIENIGTLRNRVVEGGGVREASMRVE